MTKLTNIQITHITTTEACTEHQFRGQQVPASSRLDASLFGKAVHKYLCDDCTAKYQAAQSMTKQPYEPKREYVLTDGFDTYATRLLTETEANELGEKAKRATDGEFDWVLKSEFDRVQAEYAKIEPANA